MTASLSESEKESCPNWDKLYIDNVSVAGLGNYDTEEHLILPFGAPSGSGEYAFAYRLNDDNTLSIDGFVLYPTEEYILEIPETADCYYNSDNICIKLKTPLPVRKIADNAFSKGYNSGGNLVTFSDTQPNDLLKGAETGKELKYIGRKAFSYCSNEKFTGFSTYADVIFGDSLYNCNTVNTLTLNSADLEIPDEKFGDSINLINVRTLEAKAALINIGYSESQVRVYFELNMPCTDENGNRYVLNYTIDENGAKLNGFAETPETPVDMVIPKEISDSGIVYPVKSIADSAFEGSAFVKTVVISEGVESIGSLAFKNMDSLTYASVPGSVKGNLGSGVFKSCIFLKKCDLAEGITVIPPEMFYNCQRLSSAVLPSTVGRINLGALSAGTNRLKEVAILSESFVINSGYLGESGRFDDNWGYIGTKWIVVNDGMKELLESRISANPLYPQTVVVAAVSDPVVTFGNGILTISNPDGCSKGISIVKTEYTDGTYSTVNSETIEKISLYKNSVNYDFSLYEGSNKYKVFVFRDMESISPLCKPFEL